MVFIGRLRVTGRVTAVIGTVEGDSVVISGTVVAVAGISVGSSMRL